MYWLFDLGLDLKFEMIFRLWLFIWAGFLHNWVDFVVSWCVSEILSLVIALWSWVWLGLFYWNGYGQIGLVLLRFCNFCGQWSLFFKELCCFDFLEFGWLSLRWVAVLDWLHLVEIWWFVNLVQWFCFWINELIQVWMLSFEFVFFELELLFVVIFNLVGQF